MEDPPIPPRKQSV